MNYYPPFQGCWGRGQAFVHNNYYPPLSVVREHRALSICLFFHYNYYSPARGAKGEHRALSIIIIISPLWGISWEYRALSICLFVRLSCLCKSLVSRCKDYNGKPWFSLIDYFWLKKFLFKSKVLRITNALFMQFKYWLSNFNNISRKN